MDVLGKKHLLTVGLLPAQARGRLELVKIESRLSVEVRDEMRAALGRTDAALDRALSSSDAEFPERMHELARAVHLQKDLWFQKCASLVTEKCEWCSSQAGLLCPTHFALM